MPYLLNLKQRLNLFWKSFVIFPKFHDAKWPNFRIWHFHRFYYSMTEFYLSCKSAFYANNNHWIVKEVTSVRTFLTDIAHSLKKFQISNVQNLLFITITKNLPGLNFLKSYCQISLGCHLVRILWKMNHLFTDLQDNR